MQEYSDIRKFYFENEKGERVNCQKVEGSLFLYNVSGLGYEESIQYEQLEDTFVQNNKKIVQSEISGDLEFYNMTYQEYSDFMDFILQAKELKLIYIPKKNIKTEYYRDIDFCKIEKSEEDDFNILTCPILMKCKSLWYEQNKIVYKIEPQTNEIRWEFEWDSSFIDYDTRRLEYINKGHIEAPILVSISGHVINPCISLYVEGELIQQVLIKIDIEEYEKILYGSKKNEFYIKKQNKDGTFKSLFSLDYIDFENDNVIRIPQNKSCELRLTADNEILNAEVIILPQYKIV